MARAPMSTQKVQQWIISLLVLAVSCFPLGALTAAVAMLSAERHDAALVLVGVMAALGLAAVSAGRLVRRLSPVSPWTLLGLLPALAAAALYL
jgi:putative Ca2+/H+ antiporter (TMEM165/GDT1 family)